MLLRPIARATAPLREHERLLMISISTVLVMAGQGVIVPVLPLFARELGVSTSAVGLTLSAFGFARLLLNVPLGLLSDRWGRRLLLVGGPLVTSIGMIGSGMATDLAQLLAWRFIAGAGSAMYMTGAIIYLTDISTRENRARFIGTNQGALLVGVSIGPGIGGLIAELFGLRAPFHIVGGLALIASVYAYFRIPETRGTREKCAATETAAPAGERERRPWLRMMRSRNFLAVSLVTLAIFFTRTASWQTLVPLVGVSRLGMTPGGLGAMFTGIALFNLVLVTPAALAADRFGRKAVIVPSLCIGGSGLLLFAVAQSYPTFIAAALLMGGGLALSGPAPAAFAADIAPADVRGLAMGLNRTAGDLGFVVGPPLLGLLADATSFGWGLAANATLLVVASATFALTARESHSRPNAKATAR